jgi:cytochrome b6
LELLSKIIKWFTDRLKIGEASEYLFKKKIPRHKHSFWYYWGEFTLFCLIVQAVTGVLLLFYYKPDIEEAHASIVYLTNTVPFGSLIRSVHSWSAGLLILCTAVHMFSVFFLKAYRKPRELLWMSGIILFVLILAFGFTGFLLPWNELSYFGTLVGLAEMEKFPLIGTALAGFLKGGDYISSSTLTRMFAVHTGLLPLLTLVFLFFHFLINRVNEYSVPFSVKEKKEGVSYYKDFFYRAAIGWLTILALIFTLAVLLPKDTGKAFDIYNLTEPPSGMHPEWYFMFLFQTLKSESVIPPFITVALISIFVLFWFFVPLLDKKASKEQRSPLFTIIGVFIIIYIVIMTFLAYKGAGRI